ncbi:TRAP transporter small permease [Paraglaciecola sp. MB-3u-78]|uniref:TRAP transporter small permease n=1 Tax=Paraglaciecola sp. MB-3u-78 TaxID=2058332 RepID=UPI000C31D0B8|nr:TRAP transporter small permease [Paraglaciecola sp. MB-3u-78]PKH00521.1 TRAP transporter small permease [Paraglaciecola sp. MB-3u-78]
MIKLQQTLFAINTPLGKFNYAVASVAKNLAGGLLALMLGMILAQVFFRYVLNDSLAWTEELAKFAMVWVACLVAPWAYRAHLNVSIQMFADALPAVLRRITELLITLLVMVICGIFFLQSLEFWQTGLSINASSVPVKLAYFYSCAPFAFGSICLVGLEKLIEQLCLPLDHCFVPQQDAT